MRRKIIYLLLLCIAILYFFNRRTEKPIVIESVRTTSTPTPSPSPTIKLQSNLKTIEIPYEKQILRVLIKPLSTTPSLLPNFSTKLSSSELVNKHACDVALNGGFYTKEDKPLGLFTVESKVYGEEVSSTLVTGFLSAGKEKHISINKTLPEDTSTFALQTGPLFTLPRNTPMSMVDDEFSRRSVIGEDEEGNFYAISMHDRDNLFSGPKLADVPVLLSIKKIRDEVSFSKALNLDGGSASFFYSKEDGIHLSELITVGSVLCIK